MIFLNESISDINIYDYSPLELTIYAGSLNLNKIRSIEYFWYDGTSNTTLYKPITSISNNLEDGDPKKIKQKKVFTNTLSVSSFTNKIKIYTFGSADPIIFNLNVNLNYPNVDYYTTGEYNNPIFENFHLIKTKMFGPENEILYTFEASGYERNYILNSLVNWKIKPKEIIPIKKLNKVFNISEPYNVNFSNNPSISAIPYSFTGNSDSDASLYQLYP
jgi:hypothetical protein